MWPYEGYAWFSGQPLVATPEEAPVDSFVEGFKLLGYEPCESPAFEIGYQKVAVYGNDMGATHMARQHFLGRGWLSKLGPWEDIVHRDLEGIEGDTSPMAYSYGRVTQILRRNWWLALRFGLLRGWWYALRFWALRMTSR